MTFTDPLYIDGLEFSALELRQLIGVLADEGVIDPASGALAVTERAAGPNMTVDLAAGAAVVEGDTTSDQGSYLATNDGTVNVTVPTADPSNPRIDLLVVQIRDVASDGGVNRDAIPDVVEGAPAASPTAPALPDSALPVAQIAVAAGATQISNADITDLRTPARLNRALNPFPVGAIIPYAGTVAPSTEWLICDGRAVSRTTYASLYAAVGTSFGAGDGTTTFQVPDLRGRVPFGMDNLGGTPANRVTDAAADTLGGTTGAETVALTTAQLAAHSHTATASTGNHTHDHTYVTQGPTSTVSHGHPGGGDKISASSGATPSGEGVVDSSNNTHNHTVTVTVNSAGSGQGHPNVQPSLAVGYLIRAR